MAGKKSQKTYSALMKALKDFYEDGYKTIDAIDLASDASKCGLSDNELDEIASSLNNRCKK